MREPGSVPGPVSFLKSITIATCPSKGEMESSTRPRLVRHATDAGQSWRSERGRGELGGFEERAPLAPSHEWCDGVRIRGRSRRADPWGPARSGTSPPDP